MELLIPYLSTVIGGVIVALLFTFYFVANRSSVAKKTPSAPKAGGGWPIIGHLPLLSASNLAHRTLGNLADTYGPIFTIQLGIYPALVVSSWEMAKELYTKHDLAVMNRPKYTAAKHLGYDYVMFGFAPYAAYWRKMRKIITVELFSARRLELLKHVRVSEVKTSLKDMHKLWMDRKDSSGRVLVELKQWFGDLTLNVIIRLVAGKRYFGASATADEKEARRCQYAMREFFRLLGLFVLKDGIPFLGWLDVGGHEKAMKRTAKELDDIVSGWLEEHRKKRSGFGNQGTVKEQDFIDVMLSILEGTDFVGYDSDAINKTACLNIIAGGGDTTAVALTWAVSLLLNNRHVLQKAQEELDQHVGKERLVTESDISKLIYLQAIVKEVFRLYPPAPLSGPREITSDCIVGGYHVKKGTRVITNLWKIQNDPRVWSDPLEFKPERFLTSHKDVDVKGQNFELLPFGAGRRACPGTPLGLLMVHITLASLLQAFDISTPAEAPVDMSESPGLTNMKATPLEALISPRLAFDELF